MIRKKLLSLFMVFILLTFVSCSSGNGNPVVDPTLSSTTAPSTSAKDDKYTHQAKFDVFTDGIFTEEVQADSITLNYTLANPENYGISSFTPTYGTYSVEEMKKDYARNQELLAQLHSFQYDLLDEDQQVTYDILDDLLSTDLDLDTYALYDEVLSATTGLQAQLPVLLAEFNFYDKQDVRDYIDLLKTTDSYFEQICEFQRQKSEAGLFMSDTTADDVIDQCEQFIKDPESNYLLSIFNDKIESFDFTKEEQSSLIAENKAAVLEHVIPAYENLIATLKELKGTGKNDGGLCNFEHGKTYYEYLLKQSTGSSRTPDEVKKLLENTLYSSILSMSAIASQDESVLDSVATVTYKLTDPEEILTYLKTAITADFPELQPVSCTIKYVDPSLEDHLSPAFYLTPPIDNFSQNSVYINGSDKYDLSSIFTTIAHEGYPGHLFQTVYYHQQQPSLIRSMIDFGGYSEGWATYVELYSYQLAGLDPNVAKLLQCNLAATLCLYGIIDLGVNYYGWDLDQTTKYLADFNITDTDACKSMYNAVIQDPCNYLKYTLGFVEITALKDKAQEALGDAFILKDFHEFFLKLGPAQFTIIDKYLDEWIAERTKDNATQ